MAVRSLVVVTRPARQSGTVTIDGEPLPPAFPASSVAQSSADRGWRHIRVIRRQHTLSAVAAPAVPMHLLILHLTRSNEVIGHIEGGLRLRTFARADMKLIPAGRSSEWHWRRDRKPSDNLHVYLDPDLVDATAASADGAARAEVLEHFGDLDRDIALIGASLQRELETPATADVLYAEAQATALAVLVLRKHSSLSAKALAPRKAALLPSNLLAECLDFLESRLDDSSLSVADLAAVAGLSPFHFSRLFRAATGAPPHRYVVGRRVERARALLEGTVLPLGEIAQRAGFAHQAHLTRHFSRVIGTSPGAYRQHVAGMSNSAADS